MTQVTYDGAMPLTEHLFGRAGRAGIPLSGTYELSPVCNFSCRMCYVRLTGEEVSRSPRPILTLPQWLRLAGEARDRGMLYLLLTGGEPLLWPDFWELYERLIDMGLLVSVNTNGSLIDGEAVRRLKRRPPRRINLTLYGRSEETYEALCRAKGALARVDRAVCMLKEAGIRLKLNCSLTPENGPELEQIVRYARDKAIPLQVQDYMFPPLRRDETMVGRNDRFTPEQSALYRLRAYRLLHSPEEYRRFLRRVRECRAEPPGPEEERSDPADGTMLCRAGRSAFWITWDGRLTCCGMMPRPWEDVSVRDFGEAWEDLTRSTARIRTSGVCTRCPNARVCHPCAAMALTETGSTQGIPRYLCRVAGALRELAEREPG